MSDRAPSQAELDAELDAALGAAVTAFIAEEIDREQRIDEAIAVFQNDLLARLLREMVSAPFDKLPLGPA